MKIAQLTLLLVLLTGWGYGQTIKGTVKDTAGRAIPFATVSLKNSTNHAIAAYTVTDSRGNFTLPVTDTTANNLEIEVRSMGYKTVMKTVTGVDVPVDFILSEAPRQLQEVVIKSSRPVLRTHGDTLGYKVSEFSSPQDRTIGEVLKKMPGITVAADGTIRYHNKPVSTVYIGGDNLLDDKYSIATNSIPQDAVALVQVIQNHQPVKALQNKVVSEAVALNLEMKKGVKLHLMGEESIGVGLPGKYDVNMNAMMFKDNYKAINYLAGNNTGYDLKQSLVSHNLAENNQRIDNALPGPVLSLGPANTPQLAENRYLFNQVQVISLNNLIKLKNDVQLKFNAYYVHDRQQQDYSQRTSVFLPGGTVRYNETQQNRIVSNMLHTQFTVNINRNKYYLTDVLLMDNQNTDSHSRLKTDSSAVNQVLNDHVRNFSNEFNLIRSLRSNNVFQVYSYISRSTEPENRAIDPGYNASIFNNNIPYAQLVQQVNIPSWYTNNYVSFKMPSGFITQGYRTGFSFQSQTLTSGLTIMQKNNSFGLADIAFNHVHWTRKKMYAEAAYDLPGTLLKANLTLPLTFQQVSYSDSFYALNKRLAGLYFNPRLHIKYQVSNENYLDFFYNYRNQFGSIKNIYPGLILTDYRTLYANNGDLGQQQIHQAGGSFNYRKALSLFFWSIGTLYTQIRANNITSSVITGTLQKGVVLPYVNGAHSWTVNSSISKYLFALRTTFSGSIQWQSGRSVQIQNNLMLPFNITILTYKANADTKVNDKMNFSYQATLTQTRSHSPVETSANRIGQLLQQTSVNYDPVDKLQFRLSGEYYFTRRQGNPDLKYFFADASVKLRSMKWKADFELSAANLLNVKKYNALYLSANALTAGSYSLPGRIIMMKMMFHL